MEIDGVYSPYVDSKVEVVVELKAGQMNTDLLTSLKDNLKGNYERRCLKSYGYVDRVYGVEVEGYGNLEFENMMAAAVYRVVLSCKLCMPVVGKVIVCKVDSINSRLGIAKNGEAVLCPIVSHRINTTVFYTDQNFNIRVVKGGRLVEKGDYVKVSVGMVSFADTGGIILVIGGLQDLANEKEIEVYENELGR